MCRQEANNVSRDAGSQPQVLEVRHDALADPGKQGTCDFGALGGTSDVREAPKTGFTCLLFARCFMALFM
jgi:hypothetical protein